MERDGTGCRGRWARGERGVERIESRIVRGRVNLKRCAEDEEGRKRRRERSNEINHARKRQGTQGKGTTWTTVGRVVSRLRSAQEITDTLSTTTVKHVHSRKRTSIVSSCSVKTRSSPAFPNKPSTVSRNSTVEELDRFTRIDLLTSPQPFATTLSCSAEYLPMNRRSRRSLSSHPSPPAPLLRSRSGTSSTSDLAHKASNCSASTSNRSGGVGGLGGARRTQAGLYGLPARCGMSSCGQHGDGTGGRGGKGEWMRGW